MNENTFFDLVFDHDRVVKQYGRESNKFAQNYGLDPSTQHNGEWDAFRHCYGSARTTSDFGKAASFVLGNVKELVKDPYGERLQQPDETHMDRHNNAVGRGVGGEEKNPEKIAEQCHEALKKGELIKTTEEGKQYEEVPKEENKPIEKPGGPNKDTLKTSPRVETESQKYEEKREAVYFESLEIKRTDVPTGHRYNGMIA